MSKNIIGFLRVEFHLAGGNGGSTIQTDYTSSVKIAHTHTPIVQIMALISHTYTERLDAAHFLRHINRMA